jgi:hypothetical protein
MDCFASPGPCAGDCDAVSPQWQDTLNSQKKAAKFILAAQSNEPKAKTRATNAKIIVAQNEGFVHVERR